MSCIGVTQKIFLLITCIACMYFDETAAAVGIKYKLIVDTMHFIIGIKIQLGPGTQSDPFFPISIYLLF